MARSRSNKRQQRDLNAMQSKDMGALALGIGLLLMPFVWARRPYSSRCPPAFDCQAGLP